MAGHSASADTQLLPGRHARYPLPYLSGDLIAGLTLWAVFAAQALAYARLAHATATAGLVTAIAGALMYALLGSSKRISIGPAGGIAAIVGAAVANVPAQHLTASLAILTLATGAFLCLAGLCGIAFIQRLFPTPVFVGYLAGTGVTILVGQGKDILAGNHLSIAIGATAIAAVFALKRFVPKLPAPFAVLAAATLASIAFGLRDRDVAVIGSTLGHFATPALPAGLGWSDVRALLAPALGLAMIVYVDALANASMLATATDSPVRPRREYFALGAVNLVSGMWGGFVAGTSSSRSIVAIRAGEKTKLAGAIAGVLLVLTALSVVRFLQPMPLAALAGVVFVAALDLIDWRRMREMLHQRRADFVIALIAGIAVVFVGMVEGIAIGIATALAEAFRRAMSPNRLVVTSQAGEHIYEPFCDKAIGTAGDVIVYRFGAGLFFANAEVFLNDMRQIAHGASAALRRVVVNADALGIPDITARDALVASRQVLARKGIQLVLGNVRAPQREALVQTGLPIIEEAQFLATVRDIRTSRVQRSDRPTA